MAGEKVWWQAALPALYQRASTDDDFRALCLRDPRAAIAQLGNYEMPPNLRMRFVEQLDELVLPLPPKTEGKLALDELDAVAGGAGQPGQPSVVYSTPYYPGYGYPMPVWPPVDPNTASGLPPLVKPGSAPPGYNSF